MSLKFKVIHSVFWSAIQGLGNQIISLIIFFILARLLTPEEFGLVAMANAFLAVIQIFLEQGIAQALIQRQELESEYLDTAFWLTLIIGTIITVFGVTTASLAAQFFHQPQLTLIIQCLSLLCIISSLGQVQQAFLERNFAFKELATRGLLATVISGIIGVIFAVYGFGIWSLVSQQIVQAIIGTLVLWKASDWRPRWQFSRRSFQDLSNFGINILGFKIVNFFNDKVNDFLIGYFFGAVTLGYYSLATRVLATITQVIVKTSQDIALPTFSRLQQTPEKLLQAFYQATQLTSLLALPTFLGTITLAPDLISVIGQQWLPALPLIQILAIMGILRSVTFFTSSVFIAMGKPAWWFQLGVLKMMLNLLGFGIAYQWGIIAVTWAYTLRLYIAFPIGQWAISKLIKISWNKYLRQFIIPLLSSLVMIITILTAKIILHQLITSVFITILISAIAGATTYGIAVYLLAPKIIQQLLEFTKLATSSTPK
jgi:PST family polysaccharide transporter